MATDEWPDAESGALGPQKTQWLVAGTWARADTVLVAFLPFHPSPLLWTHLLGCQPHFHPILELLLLYPCVTAGAATTAWNWSIWLELERLPPTQSQPARSPAVQIWPRAKASFDTLLHRKNENTLRTKWIEIERNLNCTKFKVMHFSDNKKWVQTKSSSTGNNQGGNNLALLISYKMTSHQYNATIEKSNVIPGHVRRGFSSRNRGKGRVHRTLVKPHSE